jgi:hypothetical protein
MGLVANYEDIKKIYIIYIYSKSNASGAARTRLFIEQQIRAIRVGRIHLFLPRK